MKGKLTRYFKYGKINKYLKSKEESQYNNLDRILKDYTEGRLKKLLSNYPYSKIEYYPHIGKRGNLLQVDFWYHNLHINIEFDINGFDYITYLPGISAEDFEQGIIKKEYDDDFNIENFFADFHNMLEKDSRLKL